MLHACAWVICMQCVQMDLKERCPFCLRCIFEGIEHLSQVDCCMCSDNFLGPAHQRLDVEGKEQLAMGPKSVLGISALV